MPQSSLNNISVFSAGRHLLLTSDIFRVWKKPEALLRLRQTFLETASVRKVVVTPRGGVWECVEICTQFASQFSHSRTSFVTNSSNKFVTNIFSQGWA